jgi:hemin uptake protein HemP
LNENDYHLSQFNLTFEPPTMSQLEYSLPVSQHGDFAPSMSYSHSDRFMSMDNSQSAQPTRSISSAPPIASKQLLQGHKTVQILHNGFLYTLQATKLGKLILTK